MAVEEECSCPKIEERVEWIYTYGDMVTLLMCFFILLFAMSKSEEERFRAVSASFKGGPPASPFMFSGMPTFMESMENAFKESSVNAEVRDMTVDDRGIVVSFSDSVLFERGSSYPTPKGVLVIEQFAKIIHSIDNNIIIEGHTDDQPTIGPHYSNWELSGARAGSVARILETYGVGRKRMQIVGYADTRPKASNEYPSLRRLNRRIDIIVKPDGL